jgi:predicted nucleic-acid-binding Zn-ribbon protein
MHMTHPLTECPHCGSADLYTRRVASGGGYGPIFLPGLGGLFRFASFDVVLCARCGRCEFFADEAARKQVPTAKGWRRNTAAR